MAALSRKTLKKKFLRFLKTPFTVKFWKFAFESFHRDTDRRVVPVSWNLADGKSVKSCVAYLTKNRLALQLLSCRYCADRAQNPPGPATKNVPRVLQITSKSVHFRRIYSRTREHRQIFGWPLKPIVSSRIMVQIRQRWWGVSMVASDGRPHFCAAASALWTLLPLTVPSMGYRQRAGASVDDEC